MQVRAEDSVFVPPRCPNPQCPNHSNPPAGWFRRRGSYQPQCRAEPVQRFRCIECRRSFSRQTFRHDYRDRRPELNELVFQLLTSGVGLRQCSRLTGLDIHSVQRKLGKLARTCYHLHRNLSPTLPPHLTFVLDEEETYERDRACPVTVPVVVERSTWFIVAFGAAPIRRLARAGSRRRLRQERLELLGKKRRDRSRTIVRWTLRALRQRLGKSPLRLQSDEKASYARVIRTVFGEQAVHETTPGTAPRTAYNPLFPINTTLAMTRDNNGRLRRQSWLNSKLRKCLVQQLHLYLIYRNYVRRRFNHDQPTDSPAALLKLLPRAMMPDETLRWRQDWGDRSPHPFSREAEYSVRTKVPAAA